MKNANNLYMDFCLSPLFSIKKTQPIPHITDWEGLFSFMKRQALVGVGFQGAVRMKEAGAEMPRRLFLQWYGMSERVREKNAQLNKRTTEVVHLLKGAGFECCILKGQGNALMYPEPSARQPGDIDVWMNGSREEVMAFVRKRFPSAMLRFHHVDFPVFPETSVELHFMPVSMNNPVYHRRLQEWFQRQRERQMRHWVELPDGIGRIPVPTTDFNIVYQLSHLMHHFFDEGIGLRQMMDYYYLLHQEREGVTDYEKLLSHLGLRKFAGAVMWVLHEVFGLEESQHIVPSDEWRGQLLLDEILKGGNFGKYSGLTNHSTAIKYFLKIRRSLRFVRAYPAEAISEPIFRTWHFFWRVRHRFF